MDINEDKIEDAVLALLWLTLPDNSPEVRRGQINPPAARLRWIFFASSLSSET
jgi:hypothetical protein